MLLDTQRGFCFQSHTHLSLVIKRTIEATVVEVHSHIGLLIRLMRRILLVCIKKIRLMPQIMTQCLEAERLSSAALGFRREEGAHHLGHGCTEREMLICIQMDAIDPTARD